MDSLAIPPDLGDLVWHTIAALLAISIGVSVLVELIKSGVRSAWPEGGGARERVVYRALTVVIGAVLAVASSGSYPFDAIPMPITVALGAGAGAHSEVVYRWAIKHLGDMVRRRLGDDDGQ